nr:EOG090X03UT [Lepidurus arcticus]
MADRKAELERKKAKLQAMREEKEKRRREKELKESEEAQPSPRSRDQRTEIDEMLSSLGVAPVNEVMSSLSSVSSLPAEQSANSTPDQSLQPTFSPSPPRRGRKKATLVAVSVQATDIPPKELVTYCKQTQTNQSTPERGVRELSEEEKQMIVLSQEFHKFFDSSTRIVERALSENVDLFVDYTGAAESEDNMDDKSGMKVSLNRVFYDERWSRHRCVMCLDWSPQFPELLAAGYHNNEESPHDPDGVVLVWNTKFKKTTPEYVFHCQSPVTSVAFARFHPNLLVGGTYSGQVVLWDNRSPKRTPVQRSPLSATSHTHPVFCLSVVGTPNAHSLVSVSTDGKMCAWSLDMLAMPQDALELQHRQGRAVAATCMAFPQPQADISSFLLGSEEGNVYSVSRHSSRAGVVETYEGHTAPVTALNCHSSYGSMDFSHLFVTSSLDWTVKLWSLKENKPLYSFEDNGDYVYDVAWSPVHPAVFATVDGTGRLDIWNLNQDTEEPTASVVLEGSPALNRVSWTQSGLHLTVGDDEGKIWVYDVGEALALPRVDEWANFAHTLHELKQTQLDQDMDRMNMMGLGVKTDAGLSSMAPGVARSQQLIFLS